MLSTENYGILHRSSSSLLNINDNNGSLLCQICFEPFKQKVCIPKLLPCGHSFCHDCITALKFHSIYICKCPICRYSFPLQYDTKFPTNYSLLEISSSSQEDQQQQSRMKILGGSSRRRRERYSSEFSSGSGQRGHSLKFNLSLSICSFLPDLLDHLQSSVMTKQSNDTTAQYDAILPSSSKVNKLKSSKISHGSIRLSHLLSKISRKDKKASDNYYTSAEPPFTSTPDMSGEEDGIEVSYVETESEHTGDSEDTIPAADSINVKSTSSRMIYIDGIALDDSTTTTTTASADYSSNSVSEKTNIEEQMIRTNFIDCQPSNEQVVQSMTPTVSTINTDANGDENTSCKSRVNLTRIWYIAAVGIQLFLAIFVLFWSLVILKIFYNDLYNTRSKSSMLCSGVEAIDKWLLLDLAQAIKCNDDSNSFFERLIHEAEVFINFLIAQFHFIPTIWSSLTSTAFIQLYDWLLEIMRNAKEVLNEYYEIVCINYLKRYYDMIWEKYHDIIWKEYYDMIWINMNDWKEKWYQTVHSIKIL